MQEPCKSFSEMTVEQISFRAQSCQVTQYVRLTIIKKQAKLVPTIYFKPQYFLTKLICTGIASILIVGLPQGARIVLAQTAYDAKFPNTPSIPFRRLESVGYMQFTPYTHAYLTQHATLIITYTVAPSARARWTRRSPSGTLLKRWFHRQWRGLSKFGREGSKQYFDLGCLAQIKTFVSWKHDI